MGQNCNFTLHIAIDINKGIFPDIMKLESKLINIVQQQILIPPQQNPLQGLSPSELEIVLDRCLEGARYLLKEIPDKDGYTDTKFMHFFRSNRVSLTSLPSERYLEQPQIIVQKSGNEYLPRYNTEILETVSRKIKELMTINIVLQRGLERILSQKFLYSINSKIDQQIEVVRHLCSEQERYMETMEPFDLRLITQSDIANWMNYDSTSTVSRLLRNLTIQIPRKETMYASDLIPTLIMTRHKGIYYLRQLQKDSGLYENGTWKVSDSKLIDILNERYDLQIARRTVTNYRNMLKTR